VHYFVEAMGVKAVATKFTRLGEAAVDVRPAFMTITELIFAIEAQVFNGQGRRGGGSWKRDTPEWLAQKTRLGLDPRINHATGALRRSVTEHGAEGQVHEMTPHSLIFGSSLPQAEPSQKNRPFFDFIPSDRAAMRTILRDYLMAAWRAA
jgi:hypothetical protein